MARPKKVQSVTFDQLAGPPPAAAGPPKDPVTGQFLKGGAGPSLTKDAFRSSLAMLNIGFTLTGAGDLVLTPAELDQLAEAWYAVLKQHPAFLRMVARGNTLTVWGNAIFVTVMIVQAKLAIINAKANAAAGGTHNPNRNNGIGQDHVAPQVDFVP